MSTLLNASYAAFDTVEISNSKVELLYEALLLGKTERGDRYFSNKQEQVILLNDLMFTVEYLRSKVRSTSVLIGDQYANLSEYALPSHWNLFINTGRVYLNQGAIAYSETPFFQAKEPKVDDFQLTFTYKGNKTTVFPKLVAPQDVATFFTKWNNNVQPQWSFPDVENFAQQDIDLFKFKYLVAKDSVKSYSLFNPSGSLSECDAWFAGLENPFDSSNTVAYTMYGTKQLQEWIVTGRIKAKTEQ